MEISAIKNCNTQQPSFKAVYKIHIPGEKLMSKFEAIEGCGLVGEDKFIKAFYKVLGIKGESVPELQKQLPDFLKMLFDGKQLSEVKEALKIPNYCGWVSGAFNGDSDFYFLTGGGKNMDKLLKNFKKTINKMKDKQTDVFLANSSIFDKIRSHVNKTFNINSLDELPAVVEKLK